MSEHREDLPAIPKEQFRVTLDNKEFPVTIRREGDDPLEVTVLVDTSDGKNALLPVLREAFLSLKTTSLRPNDHVSVFGMDGCRLRRFRTLDPAEIVSVASAVGYAAQVPSALHEKCAKRSALWDVLWYLAYSMQGLPGRRILLPITNGNGIESTKTAPAVRQIANQYGVSLFPIAERGHLQGPLRGGDVHFIDADSILYLSTVSEFSGGIVSEAIPPNLSYTLAHVFQMVRSRYILEFPRPEGMFGTHKLNVTLRTTRAMVRAGGLEFPTRQKQGSAVVTMDSLPELSLPEQNTGTATTEARPDAPPLPAPVPAITTAPQPAGTAAPNAVAATQTAQPLPAASGGMTVDPTDITGDLRPSH
ncbi:MAG: hypothetical protein V4734_04365 [Terriglobus sp.]